MSISFGEKLKEARNRKDLKQSELATQLGVKNTTISNWENNISKPDLDTLSYICGILGVKVSYFLDAKLPEDEITVQEFELIKKYRDLDDYGRETIDIALKREAERVSQKLKLQSQLDECNKKIAEYEVTKRLFAYYGRVASAGTAVEFSDMLAGTIEVPEDDINRNADYTIGVNGDSMEPKFVDGDIVYVQKATHLNKGEIGIFQKDNNIYIKKVGDNELISLNSEKYNPISGDSVTCWGKVLGKINDKYTLRN